MIVHIEGVKNQPWVGEWVAWLTTGQGVIDDVARNRVSLGITRPGISRSVVREVDLEMDRTGRPTQILVQVPAARNLIGDNAGSHRPLEGRAGSTSVEIYFGPGHRRSRPPCDRPRSISRHRTVVGRTVGASCEPGAAGRILLRRRLARGRLTKESRVPCGGLNIS